MTIQLKCQRYEDGLHAILALDFEHFENGRIDLYSGPGRFVRAWLLAFEALYPELAKQLKATRV